MRISLVAAATLLLAACASTGAQDSRPAPGDRADEPEGAEAAEAVGAAEEVDKAPDGATPSAAELTRRVASVSITPDPIEIERGDTIRVQGRLTDASGEVVRGARWGLTDGGVFEVESIKDEEEDTYLLRGVGAGEGALGVFLGMPGDSAGQVNWQQAATVPVRVRDFPVARVEIAEPPAAAYTGTTVPLEATAFNTAGEVHGSAEPAYRSSDASVATVSDGRLTFLSPGTVDVVAEAEGVRATRTFEVRANPVRTVSLSAPAEAIRTGDVVRLRPSLTDAEGRSVEDAAVAFEVDRIAGGAARDPNGGSSRSGGAEAFPDGAFVAEESGRWRVNARTGTADGSVEVEVLPRSVEREVTLVGQGPVGTATSDLWVFEGLDGRDYAYTGTMSAATVFAWDVTDPANPVKTDSLTVDGRRVNDVKVNDDRTIAIVTSENASDRRNGITLLDITEPAHPRVITHYTEGLTGGVHNVWFVGDLVYAIHNGTLDVHIIDISDPGSPFEAGRWGLAKQDKYLHDVSVVDGLAYLSYWDDGLVVLDAGDGRWGGTPTEPVFVSSLDYRYDIGGESYGNTHHAIRYGDYVFLGDEIFGCPGCEGPRGYVHVVDVSDIENPEEVAHFRLPDAGTHNLWVEDDLLYIAYYQGGLRVVDVSGELRGDLLAQGRQVAHFQTDDPSEEGDQTMAWGPQPYKGNVFVSDMRSGLWIVRIGPGESRP